MKIDYIYNKRSNVLSLTIADDLFELKIKMQEVILVIFSGPKILVNKICSKIFFRQITAPLAC